MLLTKYTIFSVLCFTQLCMSFYLPGVAPTDYTRGEDIPILVNHIAPTMHRKSIKGTNDMNAKTYIFSYDYYYPRFHFCRPQDGPKKQSESLGSIIFGDRIFNSPFEVKMLEEKSCQTLCKSSYSKSDATFVNRNIRAGYNYNWIIDGLPAAKLVHDENTNSDFFGSGFPIGEVSEEHVSHLYNHFEIQIEYHERTEGKFRVVGVTVSSMSLDRSGVNEDDKEKFCSPELSPVTLEKQKDTDVWFTYSVKFIASDTPWATRWDKYLHVYDPKIQWFSLFNFSLIVVILGIIMAHILTKALKSDIMKYNEVNLDDDISDESGWKLIHADVFRPPKNRLLLSCFIGSGVQLFLMVLVTIVFALFGLLSPANRGSLSTFMFMLFVLLSIVSSYVSSFVYRQFKGEDWKMNMLLTPILVPGLLFGSMVLMNFFLIFVKSSGAIPIGTMLATVAIWFLISLPLSVLGAILASKRPSLSMPVKVNQIPRQIPPQVWYLRTVPTMLISGIFPFGSIAVEMYFIYTSIWFNRIYYMFGFLFFCFVLMILTTALISVLMVYSMLCTENYKWQWRSVFVGGSCSIYVFLHTLLLASSYKITGFTSVVLYFGYSILASFLFFLCCGSVGFICSFFFVRAIYSQIKID